MSTQTSQAREIMKNLLKSRAQRESPQQVSSPRGYILSAKAMGLLNLVFDDVVNYFVADVINEIYKWYDTPNHEDSEAPKLVPEDVERILLDVLERYKR